MTFVKPPHVSEREEAHTWPGGAYDGPADEDCVWCSGIMLRLASQPGSCPATLYEAERLRQDAGLGPSGGANANDLLRGYAKRYGWTEPHVVSNSPTALWAALQPGMGAAALGKLSYFPAGHRLRRFIPTWTGGHAVFVARLDGTDRVWWMDPEGPLTGYSGEWATKAELATFVGTYTNHVVAPLALEDELIPITDSTPKLVTTRAGAVYYDPATGAVVSKAVAENTRPSAYASGPYRAVVITRSTGVQQLVGVKSTGDAAVTITAVPDPVAAARAAGYAEAKTRAAAAVEGI